MPYVTETWKDVETATRDLEETVKRNEFGVLHIHDPQKTLKEKGVNFPNACKILEVCNPQRATQVLTTNMAVNMALPCRISVYQEGGRRRSGWSGRLPSWRCSPGPLTSSGWRRK